MRSVSLAETADLTAVFWFEISTVAQAVGEAQSEALLSAPARYQPEPGSKQALHVLVTELRPVCERCEAALEGARPL